MFTQIIGLFVFVTLIVSICVTKRKWSLAIQSVSCLLAFIYDALITAYTGAVVELINFIRSLLFANKRRLGHIFYIGLLAIFEIFIIVNCYITWVGWISLLPTVASVIRTYCLWQSKMALIRISGVTTGILFGIYYLHYDSFSLVVGYGILVIVSAVRIIQLDLKHRPTVKAGIAN